ncbi:hypothetical protein ACIO6T_40645 [Streptomyces sp. NPDC087532]
MVDIVDEDHHGGGRGEFAQGAVEQGRVVPGLLARSGAFEGVPR